MKEPIKHEIIIWRSATQMPVHTLNMALKRFNRPLLVEVKTGCSSMLAVVVLETKHRDEGQTLYNIATSRPGSVK